jgi:hypothetical protein
MFEREIKFIYDFNLNKVNRLGPYFTFEQLLSADLHPAILQYISAEIDYLVFEDRQNLLKNSVFDYSGEKISFHFNQISEEVKKTKRFALEYIAKQVMHASSFTVNYLVHPKWTLTKFVFDEENHKSTNEIKQILNYVYYYKYITKILVSYINAKKILSMNAQEFEELLNKADKLGIESNLSGILSSSLKSMAEFFNIGEKIKTKIPLSAVEIFLEEKELTKHLTKTVEMLGNDENARFNLNDYEKIFNNVVIEKETAIHEIREESVEETVTEEQIEPLEIEEAPETEIEEKIEHEMIVSDNEDEHENDRIEELEQVLDLEKVYDEEEKIIDESDVEDKELAEEIIQSDKEIIITQPTKLRIRVNEDIRIEPVIEEENLVQEVLQFEEEKEAVDELETIEDEKLDEEENTEEELAEENITDDEFYEIDIPMLQLNAEKTTEEIEFIPQKEITEEEAEIEFQKELELAQRNLESNFVEELNDKEMKEELVGEINDEDESLSFMIKHKDDITEETKEEIEEEVNELIVDQNIDGNEEENTKEEVEEETVEHVDKEIEKKVTPIKMELAEILEHKEMTRIIDVIFDYDIEDFASILDEISNCKNIDEAERIVSQTLTDHDIDRNSEEAVAFRKIISEHFSHK